MGKKKHNATRVRRRFGWRHTATVIVKGLRQFYDENGIDKASILAYYSIFSSFFLLMIFSFVFRHFIDTSDSMVKLVYPFSPELANRIAPIFFERANRLAGTMGQMGVVGFVVFLFLGILIFKKLIQYINEMFHIKIKKGFILRRMQEWGVLLLVGMLVMLSVFLTGFISTVSTLIYQNQWGGGGIDPNLVESIDNFLVRYLVPFLVTFLLFFILFKWIPEKKVCVRAALMSGLLSALIWEIVKRGYTYYLIHYSLVGKMQGTVITIILFGFWMEVSMGIILYGAKLTYLFDKEKHG